MAAQAQLRATDSGGGDKDSDGLIVAVSLCFLHDLLGVVAFLACHPLHAAYFLFFARHLLSLASFFYPLLVSTALLLAVLVTVGPYIGGAEWRGVRSLGRTCGIAVAALCAELRPEGAGGDVASLVGQLCSFVLGPGDAASVLRVGEIMGELCDIGGSCFVLEEKSLLLLGGDECKELAFQLPLMDGCINEKSFLDHEDFGDFRDEIDDKVVVSEDLKGSDSLAEQCCPSETIFVQEIEAEDVIQDQRLILSGMEEISDGIEEKRLECDPVSVEIKKCEPVESMEIKKSEPVESMEIKKYEPVESMEIQKCEPVKPVEVKKFKPVEPTGIKTREPVKPHSSIAQRIKLWEAQVSGNFKPVLEEKEDSSVEFSLENGSLRDVKKQAQFETDPCVEKCGSEQEAQELASVEQSVEQQQAQAFVDVKECVHPETETFAGKCSHDVQAEETGIVAHTEQEFQEQDCQYAHLKTKTSAEKCSQDTQAEESAPIAHAEIELHEQGCKDAQPEPELQEQEYKIARSEQELQEREEYKDVTESPVMCNERENSLKFTSIAGRVHSRSSSENLVSEGSPLPKEKEWKRTLACKLYEERMQLRLCRDRAVVEGSDNMDMLWEAYEVGSGSNGRGVKRGTGIVKGDAKKQDEFVEEGDGEEEEDEHDNEGSMKQLCCLQALKFSTRKMNFGGGKRSLAKITKVLKRMTALSRVGSQRKRPDEGQQW
ncbi:uncharacterized protein LOC133886968 [Phragmites australis]|uniref:uncharacterized protein LOC133886968 n=1 Tax=Phragmites australis TaxID=29695 RepID=UPI002D787487|nr:uncharacterized protein LOC133886968 [Phragmites australis]